MRLQEFSDLHVDVAAPNPIATGDEVDAVIYAGDVCEGVDKAFRALRSFVPLETPILFVLGNHEYYRPCVPEELAVARALARDFNVHVLENDIIELGRGGSSCGVRFAGCTLWTDYQIFGASKAAAAMAGARRGMNDHRLISWSKQPWRRFRPEEALTLHTASKAFLENALLTPFAGPTVLVTHHAHAGSVHPDFQSDLLTAAFASDLSGMLKAYQPDILIHGHVHHCCDYRVGKTRVVCNPHGYADENRDFDPCLIVEVGR